MSEEIMSSRHQVLRFNFLLCLLGFVACVSSSATDVIVVNKDVGTLDVRRTSDTTDVDVELGQSVDVQVCSALGFSEKTSVSPICAPLYRYQPDRANSVFKSSLPDRSIGLNDFGNMGVPALGRGESLPTLQECSGVMASKTCAHFDGDDSYAVFQTLPLEQPLTLVAVLSSERDGWETVSDSVSSERHRMGIDPSGRGYIQAPTPLQSNNNTDAGQWSFLCARAEGEGSEVRLNNLSVFGSAGANAPIDSEGQTGFVIGRNATNQLRFKGDLLEYAVYPASCEASCEEHAERYYAHRYPELGLSCEAPHEETCARSPQSLCPPQGECKIVVVGDSILQGVNPGAPSPGGSSCHVAAGQDSYCTTSEDTSGLCPCNGEKARTGLVDAMLASIAKPDCYSRLNRAQSGSLTNTWRQNQWDSIRDEVVADVAVIGGANNDWSTPSMRTCENVQAMALDMLASGVKKVLILGGHPQGRNDDHSASREVKRLAENTCLAEFALSHDDVVFQSFDGSIVDEGGAIALDFDWGDGLHFSSVGEEKAAGVFGVWFE